MKIARSGPRRSRGRRGRPRSCGSGARRRCGRAVMSIMPRCSLSSMISPAQVPSTGTPAGGQLPQRPGQPLALDPERHRGGLPAGDHEAVEALEVARARAPGGCPRRAPEHPLVGLEAALQGEHADQRWVLPRGPRRAATSRAVPAAARRGAWSSRGSPSGSRDRVRRPPPARGPASGWWPRRSPAPARAGPGT